MPNNTRASASPEKNNYRTPQEAKEPRERCRRSVGSTQVIV